MNESSTPGPARSLTSDTYIQLQLQRIEGLRILELFCVLRIERNTQVALWVPLRIAYRVLRIA